ARRFVSQTPHPAPRVHRGGNVAALPPAPQTRTVVGLISATQERAKSEARRALEREVVRWLDPQVPPSWSPPAPLLNALVLKTRTDPAEKGSGTLSVAELKYDVSPNRRAELVEAYNRDLVQHRLAVLGATLAFILICLAAISSYIRADEATKG